MNFRFIPIYASSLYFSTILIYNGKIRTTPPATINKTSMELDMERLINLEDSTKYFGVATFNKELFLQR